MVRVVVVEDHFITRKGIVALLAENPRIQVVAEGSAGEHLLELTAVHDPDVLITDLQMPAHAAAPHGPLLEPIAAIRKLLALHPELAILIISQEQDSYTMQTLAELGVRGYLLKSDDFAATLGQAVEMIAGGLLYFSPEVRHVVMRTDPLPGADLLTPQQITVLRALLRSPEASRPQLAGSLHISTSTLQKHITAIFSILDVPNMAACVLKAMRMRLVDVDALLGDGRPSAQ